MWFSLGFTDCGNWTGQKPQQAGPHVTVFSGRGNSRGFHLVSPIILALAPQVMEPKWEFCQLLSLSIPVYILQPNHRMSSGTCWTHCESDISQNSINHLALRSPNFTWMDTMFLGISQNLHQFRTSIQPTLEILLVSFLPAYT